MSAVVSRANADGYGERRRPDSCAAISPPYLSAARMSSGPRSYSPCTSSKDIPIVSPMFTAIY
jgi:hypothetical protein